MEAALLTMNAALLTIVAATFVAVLGSIYEQRREGTKTRDKLDETNGALQELTSRTTVLEASHQHLLQDFAEHRRITEKNHNEVTGSLADARERLARIEGHLGIGLPPPNATES
ncbi:MAG: hypothetical protein F4Y12_12350 [Acidimicrobiaceae bacterium]|nr:hypothetical protein [Acidimicrobiaceae bacterium]MYH77807.1 hypothetical protein [Acidimicrobiaceae bacterium]MYK76719.1 hypothetical protein [Acidimicrobiaceae bacterium]